MSKGCARPICDLLASYEPKMVYKSLMAIKIILKKGEINNNPKNSGDDKFYDPKDDNYFIDLIYDEEGLEKIERFQGHDSIKIDSTALGIFLKTNRSP